MSLGTKVGRILLVDDDRFMLKILGRMLERLGYADTVACDSGQRALEQLVGLSAAEDLIFLDVKMPGMDGVEFIRRLVEHRYRGHVVLISAENDRILESVERLIEIHKLRGLGRLRKPVGLEELKRVMGRLRPEPAPMAQPHPDRPILVAEQLRTAIAQGELVNHYQPQVCLATRQIFGVETLVRWQQPNGPLIYPDQFLPLAESSDQLTDITQSVLATAMKHAKAWRQAGESFNVAVNVSMRDLAALDFPDKAAGLAHAVGVDPTAITLEVTEGQVMSRLSTVLEVLTRLRLKRFRMSIDDFGTGHSSLAQLRDLPFDELKIDRGFVHGASSNDTRRAICSASLRMAQQLKMQVVAEGIEEPADWELLVAMGCDVGQGYLVSRPMPPADLLPWIAAWNAQYKRGSPLLA
jgi:EAL domain-containing protein (putative c-di-GMP-specific phosphodiesterase class I)/ActR/RegA family two-component response regulator